MSFKNATYHLFTLLELPRLDRGIHVQTDMMEPAVDAAGIRNRLTAVRHTVPTYIVGQACSRDPGARQILQVLIVIISAYLSGVVFSSKPKSSFERGGLGAAAKNEEILLEKYWRGK
ncbi:Uncharacterised protein [Legionella lansingensis]|nr:Uncharacterised protein [Legionella lansingensis]